MAAAKPKKSTDSEPDLLVLAFDLIADKGWTGFSFSDLAERAGTTLASVRGDFKDKTAILDAFSRRLDQAMLAVDREELAGLPRRDRVFELMMSRLEALSPLRAGVIRMMNDARRQPDLALTSLCRIKRSMAWLHDAAGLSTDRFRSSLQQRALTAVYLKALHGWSSDDSGELAKTMAALDKDLRRLETIFGLAE